MLGQFGMAKEASHSLPVRIKECTGMDPTVGTAMGVRSCREGALPEG
jgi:hypothetical protein